jgi:PPOX class probable FMN-dependent enzyme
MARIETLEALRRLIPDPNPRTALKVADRIEPRDAAFLARAPFAVLATVDAHGTVEASPKGDVPGFIRVEDERTVVLPERAGNNLCYGPQNILATGRAALMVVIPGTSETLRISGAASLHDDPDLLESLSQPGRPALLAIRIRAERVFFHCARSFLRAGLWRPETWGARHRVNFGDLYAERTGGGDAVRAELEKVVETAYGTGLWHND